MKTLFTCWFFLSFFAASGFSQNDTTISDFNVALKLINQPADKLTSLIQSLNLEIYITSSDKSKTQLYLQRRNSSVRSFVLKIGNIYKGSDSDKIEVASQVCRGNFCQVLS